MKNPATPSVRKLAGWLVAREAAAGNQSDAEAAFQACEKLRHSLSALVGVAGFRSLLSRALTMAKAEVPWLNAAKVRADGSLEDPGSLNTKQGRAEAERGGVVLLAQLLGLLDTFIGEALMMGLVRDVWPDLPFGMMGSETEEES
jgi:hypothetical protein